MRIYIPSRGRPDRTITADALANAKIRFTIVCSKIDDTVPQYIKRWGKENILVVNSKNICEKRQKIVEHARLCRIGKICMMDDDLRFYARLSTGTFRTAAPVDLHDMVAALSKALDEVAHAGLVDKFMSQHSPRGHVSHGRYNQVLAYNLKKWPKNVRFRLPVNQEHDVHLQLSTQGLPPRILTEFSKDAPYYAKGGCSFYRTPEVEERGHRMLAENFPEYVKVVPHKKSISGLAIRVKWQKADGVYTDKGD